jgi:hypothetical protein
VTFTEQQFRVIGYLPRSLQSSPTADTDVLVPGAGAPHSDEFRLATVPGLTGYKPYLKLPEGRRGTWDPLRERYEQGTMNLWFIDAKLAFGQEAQRWVAAYSDRLATALMRVQWREHPGDAFTDWYTGRVRRVYRDALNLVGVQLADPADDLDYDIGAVRPDASASGVVAPTLLPYAVSAAYGTIPAYNNRGRLRGTVKSQGATRYIELDQQSAGRPDNIVSKRLVDRARVSNLPLGLAFSSGAVAAGLRIRFSASSPSIVEKELVPSEFKAISRDGPPRCAVIAFVAAPTADPFYIATDTTTIPDGTVVTFDVREDTEPTTLIASSTVLLARDIIDGKYGPRTPAGVRYRAVARDTTSFAAYPTGLLNGPQDFAGRWVLRKTRGTDWLQRQLLQPAMLGYRFNASGQAEIFSWARPTSLAGLVTLTDLDLARPRIEWEENAEQGKTDFSFQTVLEVPLDPQKIGGRPDEFPDLPMGLLQEVVSRYRPATPGLDQWGSIDLKPGEITVEGNGYRFMQGEVAFGGVSKEAGVIAQMNRLSEVFGALYGGRGPQYLKWTCRRTANTVQLKPGMWCIVDFDWNQNTSTLQLGGSRLVLLTRVTEAGLTIGFEAIDAGPNVLAAAPTLGAPVQEVGNTRYGFTMPVTLNGSGDPVVVWVNFTSTSVGTRPADDDPGWMPAFPAANAGGGLDFRIRATGTQVFRVNPPGKRVWLRGQTMPASYGGTAKLPSVFAYPSSGTGYVDLDALPAPTGHTISSITANAARLSWTPGDANLPTVVLLGSGASEAAADASFPVVVSPQLYAGATRFDLTGLDLGGPWYRAQVAHLDQWGNPGPRAGTTPTSFEATGTAVEAPAPGGIVLSRGGSTSGAMPPANGGISVAGRTGIEVILVPGPAGIGFDARIYRAVETGVGTGTFGSFALLTIIPGELIQAAGYPFQDLLPEDSLRRRYKFTLIGAGATESAESNVVEDLPGWLPVVAYGTVPGEPVLGQVETLVLGAGDFLPESDTGGAPGWFFGGAFMSPGTGIGSLNAYASIPSRLLPVGVQILQVRARVRRQADDALILALRYYVDNAGTLVDSVTAGSTGNFTITMTGSSVGHIVGAGRTYVLDLLMDAFATASDVGLYRVEIDFIRNSYRQ